MKIADLPEDQKLKIRKLVETLDQRTQQRNHYKQLYEQALEKIQKMEQELETVKASKNAIFNQFKNSFAAINKVRSSAEKIARSQKQIKKQDEWQDVEHQNSSILMNEKSCQSNEKNKTAITVIRPPLLSSSKKQLMPVSFMNESQYQSSSKKKQIETLKKQLNQLRCEMKSKQLSSAPMSQKMRKCEQIKKRYLKKNITQDNIQTPQKVSNSHIFKLKSQISDDENGSIDKQVQEIKTENKYVVKDNKFVKPQSFLSTQQAKSSKIPQRIQERQDFGIASPKKLVITEMPRITKKAGRSNNLYQDSLFDLIEQLDN